MLYLRMMALAITWASVGVFGDLATEAYNNP